jgi:hypothetical protein
MPHPNLIDLRELQPIDDASAAAAVSSETHGELLDAVLASSVRDISLRPRVSRSSRRPLVLATALAAIVAVLLIATPGLLSGGNSATQPQSAQAEILHRITAALARKPGTIVIEQEMLRSSDTIHGMTTSKAYSMMTITETAASRKQRVFSSTSATRPGFQQLTAGSALELYDPTTRTVYATTERGWERATIQRIKKSSPKGTKVRVGTMTFSSPYSPGRTSVFEQQLRDRLYKIAGRTTVDGRAALKLVPSHGTVVLMNPRTGAHQVLGTVYVARGTYAPIREVLHTGSHTVTASWSLYRVLPDTSGNRWLVSLTARHPRAGVVRSATAFIAAQARENERPRR